MSEENMKKNEERDIHIPHLKLEYPTRIHSLLRSGIHYVSEDFLLHCRNIEVRKQVFQKSYTWR